MCLTILEILRLVVVITQAVSSVNETPLPCARCRARILGRPYRDESQGQTAMSPQRAWNRYKQQSAKVWPRMVQAIDWRIDPLNCFSWARLHLGSIKHCSIFSPRQCWWQRLIRKHLSTLSQFPRAIVTVSVLWELLVGHFRRLFFCSFATRKKSSSQVIAPHIVFLPEITRLCSVLRVLTCCTNKAMTPVCTPRPLCAVFI